MKIAGPEEFSAMRDQYLRVGQSFVIVCAVNDESSLRDVRYQVDLLIRCKDYVVNDMPIVFVMNKMDLLKENRAETVEKYKSEFNSIISEYSLLNCSIVMSSAKLGENVTLIFEELIRKQRLGGVDNVALLQGCVEYDVAFIDECKKRVQKQPKKCNVM